MFWRSLESAQRDSPPTANMQASTTTDETNGTDTKFRHSSFVIRHSQKIRVIRGSLLFPLPLRAQLRLRLAQTGGRSFELRIETQRGLKLRNALLGFPGYKEG